MIPVFFSEKRPDRSAFSTLILVCFNAAVGKFVLLCRKRAPAHCIPEQKGNRQKIDHKIKGKYAIKCVFIKRNTFITLALSLSRIMVHLYFPTTKSSVRERPRVCFPGYELGFPTGQESATFRDKGTEVPLLFRDKGTMRPAQILTMGRDGSGQPKSGTGHGMGQYEILTACSLGQNGTEPKSMF